MQYGIRSGIVRPMARPLRIELPGAVYHITARGNARQSIFLDDTDRETFLELLSSSRDQIHLALLCLLSDGKPLPSAYRDTRRELS